MPPECCWSEEQPWLISLVVLHLDFSWCCCSFISTSLPSLACPRLQGLPEPFPYSHLHIHVGASHLFQRHRKWHDLLVLSEPAMVCTQIPFFLVLCLRLTAGGWGFCRRLKRCLVSGRYLVLTEMLTGQTVFFKCYFFAFAHSPWSLFPPEAPFAFISFKPSKQILPLHLLHLWE